MDDPEDLVNLLGNVTKVGAYRKLLYRVAYKIVFLDEFRLNYIIAPLALNRSVINSQLTSGLGKHGFSNAEYGNDKFYDLGQLAIVIVHSIGWVFLALLMDTI